MRLRPAFALAALLLGPSTAEGFARAKTRAGLATAWAGRSFELTIDARESHDVPTAAAEATVRRALGAWTQGCSYLRLEVAPEGSNAIAWIPSGWAQDPAATALTTLIYRTGSGEIVDADIAINGERFRFSGEAGPVRDRFDLESVVVHELGHAIGLDHSASPGATMQPVLAADVSARDLAEDDVAGACAIYPLAAAPSNPAPEDHAGGCSSVGHAPLLVLLGIARRRGRS